MVFKGLLDKFCGVGEIVVGEYYDVVKVSKVVFFVVGEDDCVGGGVVKCECVVFFVDFCCGNFVVSIVVDGVMYCYFFVDIVEVFSVDYLYECCIVVLGLVCYGF